MKMTNEIGSTEVRNAYRIILGICTGNNYLGDIKVDGKILEWTLRKLKDGFSWLRTGSSGSST
jgi:hypothetical protein